MLNSEMCYCHIYNHYDRCLCIANIKFKCQVKVYCVRAFQNLHSSLNLRKRIVSACCLFDLNDSLLAYLKVLRVSFCDGLLSVVRCLSCRINIYPGNALEATFLLRFSWNLLRWFVLMKSWMSLKMGDLRKKSRSLGQISLKACEHSIGHIFAPIFMKFVLIKSWTS
jgi:hypothetical protein